MKIVEIFTADVYRDGGSYGFCFHSDDGNWYEFFTKRDLNRTSGNDYLTPIIFLESCNDNNVVATLNWSEAQEFVKGLEYNERMRELITIVFNNGDFPKG